MNEIMDFSSPGHPMSHLLYRSVDGDRHISRPEMEQKPLGWTEGLVFLGVFAGIILLVIALERWERRKMKEFWNASTKGGNHHAQHQKKGRHINEH